MEAEAAVCRGLPIGPLHGIPVTCKDVLAVRGMPLTGGSRIHADRVGEVDGPVAERLRQAGAVTFAKTTVPEFGWVGCGDSPLTGTSHNPWKPGHTPGGSSAGAAICAAAGIGPLHQGSDGAGSVRIPAAFCGVYGFKPSFGRVPYHPMPNNDSVSHIGPLTRTVADAALMLSVMAGPDERDSASLPDAPEPYLARLQDGIRGLRVAFSPDFGYLRVDAEVADPVRAAVAAFAEQGAIVEETSPGWGDPIEMARCFWAATFAGNQGGYVERWADRMDPALVACIEDGLRLRAVDLVRARQQRLDLAERVQALFARYDLLVSPTLSVAAFPSGRIIPEHWEQHPWDWLRWAGFAYPFNLTGLPAANCPCGFTADGRPVGLQIVAGRFRDLRVLQASRAFEQARPWAALRPPLPSVAG